MNEGGDRVNINEHLKGQKRMNGIQLLSSFDGTVIYPKTETKDQIFDEATDNKSGQISKKRKDMLIIS